MRCPYCSSSNIHLIMHPLALPDLRQAATCLDCGLIFIVSKRYKNINNPGHTAPAPPTEPLSHPNTHKPAPTSIYVTCPFCLGNGKLTEQKYRYIVERMVTKDGAAVLKR